MPNAGGVKDRSQGLSLRNPWTDPFHHLHPGGMRETTTSRIRFSHPSGMRSLLTPATRGFEDSTPGYVLAPLRGDCDGKQPLLVRTQS